MSQSQLITVFPPKNWQLSSNCRSIKMYHFGWFLSLLSSDPCSNLSPPVPPHLLQAPCRLLRSFQAGRHHLAEPFWTRRENRRQGSCILTTAVNHDKAYHSDTVQWRNFACHSYQYGYKPRKSHHSVSCGCSHPNRSTSQRYCLTHQTAHILSLYYKGSLIGMLYHRKYHTVAV